MIKSEMPVELLPQEKIKLVIKSINDSILQYKQNVNSEELPTQNGRYHQIWNYIFKNIKGCFADSPYKCYNISRGKLWEFVAVYDQDNNMLYVVMKEETFKKIRNGKNKEFHYIRVLNVLNNFEKSKNKQTSLFPEDEEKSKHVKDDLERMIEDIDGNIKICVDILFSQKQNKVTSISGNIYDYDLDEIKSCSWNKYIEIDIDEITDTEDEYNIENPPIELNVREHLEKGVKHEKENTEEMVASKETQKKNLVKK